MKKFFSLFLIIILALSGSALSAEAANMDQLNDEKIKVASMIDIESKNSEVAFNLEKEKAVPSSASAVSTEKSKNEIEVFNQNGSQLKITKADIDLMAKLVYAESRGEPFQGKVAVASVVLNRVMSPQFPDTISGVIFQKNAFSCVKNGRLDTQTNESCYDAVYQAIKGKDPTNEALFFYNPTIATCSWMKETSKKDSKVIGNHTFFKH